MRRRSRQVMALIDRFAAFPELQGRQLLALDGQAIRRRTHEPGEVKAPGRFRSAGFGHRYLSPQSAQPCRPNAGLSTLNTRSTSVREFKQPPGEPVRAQYFGLLTPTAQAEKRPRTVYILNEIGDTDPVNKDIFETKSPFPAERP